MSDVYLDNWMDIGLDHKILFSSHQYLYHQAMSYCQEKGGQLLEPISQRDLQMVTALVQRDLQWSSFWIGVNDFVSEGS